MRRAIALSLSPRQENRSQTELLAQQLRAFYSVPAGSFPKGRFSWTAIWIARTSRSG
jgi:hypothetical protein